MLKTVMKWSVVGLIVLFVLIQLVPYGRAHTNPPVRQELAWDSAQTRELAARACFDCHSNETRWPWYSNVAPVSWLVQRDVDAGRTKLNFSEWGRRQKEAEESVKTVRKGEMPPWYYPWARLSAEERQALIRGLTTSVGGEDAEALNRADSICYEAERLIAEHGERLTADVRTRIETARRETREALSKRDVAVATERAEALKRVLQEAGSALYAGAAATRAPEEPPKDGRGAGTGGVGHRVVDAEYRESR